MNLLASVVILVLLSGGLTVTIARAMFKSCTRHDLQQDGRTPGMFHVVDPYIAGLVEKLYRAGQQGKRKGNEDTHVSGNRL